MLRVEIAVTCDDSIRNVEAYPDHDAIWRFLNPLQSDSYTTGERERATREWTVTSRLLVKRMMSAYLDRE